MKTFVLLGLFALAFTQAWAFNFGMADPSDDPDERPIDKHEKHEACCVPEQWEGHKCIMVPSKDYLNEAFYSYDAKEHRDYMIGHVLHRGQVIDFELLRLFKKHKQYLLVHQHGDKKGRKCTAAPLMQDWKEFCIPKDAKFIGTSTIGGKLEVNSWNFTMGHHKMLSTLNHELDFGSSLGLHAGMELVIGMCVTKKCIPTEALVFPANQEGRDTPMPSAWKRGDLPVHYWPNIPNAALIAVRNVTKGIKDHKVFEPPKECGQYE